jgi:hypothetical protein
MTRSYHGPSAEPGLTAEEYRETMDEYYKDWTEDEADYQTPPDEEENTDVE